MAEEAGLAPLASHPEGDREPLPVGGEFSDPGADHSLPVFHRGELLGGISLVSQGETFPPSEVELVEDLSAGLGLVLHNAGLTRRLQEQVDALEASRERVLAAADSARRSLEQDLDSGPQQQLVALKVMLGPTRVLAEQAGAEKTAGVLAQLEDEAGDAIRAVREFSGGVYPPLLEAEGLAAAMAERVGRATLPVAFRADGVGRFPREVEAAVYFTVLEALQNAAKYAEPSSVEVVLEQADGRVQFRVSDDGVGFDESTTVAGSGLANMSDRIDAVGGSLEIASLPGEGTTVSGSVPV